MKILFILFENFPSCLHQLHSSAGENLIYE